MKTDLKLIRRKIKFYQERLRRLTNRKTNSADAYEKYQTSELQMNALVKLREKVKLGIRKWE